MKNLSNCKHLHNTLYNVVADNLHEFLAYCPMTKRDTMDNDMRINGLSFLDFQNQYNSKEIIRAYDYFFYE